VGLGFQVEFGLPVNRKMRLLLPFDVVVLKRKKYSSSIKNFVL
jgi:hypothetical protein